MINDDCYVLPCIVIVYLMLILINGFLMKPVIKILKPIVVSSLAFSSIVYALPHYGCFEPPIDPDIGIEYSSLSLQ